MMREFSLFGYLAISVLGRILLLRGQEKGKDGTTTCLVEKLVNCLHHFRKSSSSYKTKCKEVQSLVKLLA